MLKKLKLALRNARAWHLPLILKAGVFSFALFLGSKNLFWAIVFFIVAGILYFIPASGSAKHKLSFFILAISSFIVTSKFGIFAENQPDSSAYLWLFAASILFFGFLFFLLLGIKNLQFIYRKESYYLLNSFIFLSVFSLVFSADKSWFFTPKILAGMIAFYFLFKEAFNYLTEEEKILSIESSKKAYSILFAFIIAELIWAVGLLPIGFINASAIGLLSVLILEDTAINHWSGTLKRRRILRNISFFLFLIAVIFAASKWSL